MDNLDTRAGTSTVSGPTPNAANPQGMGVAYSMMQRPDDAPEKYLAGASPPWPSERSLGLKKVAIADAPA